MKKCPYCAEEIQDEAIVCRYCGLTLDARALSLTEAVKPKQSQVRKTWTAIAGLSLGLVVVSLFCMMTSPEILGEYPAVNNLVTWALGLGAIGALVGLIARGFSK